MNGSKIGTPLARTQLGALAALLLCAQMPLWAHVDHWVAFAGTMLVVARLVFPFDRNNLRNLRRWLLPVLAIAAAIGIRVEYGYFIARDPCVAFLYVLVGIKFLEARGLRDGTLLVCLALFLALTQFFYAQTILAAAAAIPALLATRRCAGGPADFGAVRREPWRAASAHDGATDPAGHADRGAAVRPVSAPGRTAVGKPARKRRAYRAVREHVARVDQRACRSPTRSPFASTSPRAAAAIANATGAARCSRVSTAREWRAAVQAARRSVRALAPAAPDRLHGDAGAARQALAVRARASDRRRPAHRIRTRRPDGPTEALAAVTYDQQLLAKAPITQAVRYTMRSATIGTFAAVVDDASRQSAAAARQSAHGRIRARAARAQRIGPRLHRRRARLVPHRAVRLHAVAAVLDRDPVDGFLFDTRRGFCEHYAGAFVVLLRAAGIPSRVVTGYQGGEMNPTGEYMIVRQSDAHAWAEALLDGKWRRFDPTAAVAPSRIERGLGARAARGRARAAYLARLEMTWLKSLQLHWDASISLAAATSSASISSGSAISCANRAQRARRRGSSSRCVAGMAFVWGVAVLGWLAAAAVARSTPKWRCGTRLPQARARRACAPAGRRTAGVRRRAPPRAGRNVADAVRRTSASRYATLRYGPAPRTRRSAGRCVAQCGARASVGALPTRRCALRAGSLRTCATSSASRDKPLRRSRAPQLFERLGLDLAHALASDAELARRAPRAWQRRGRSVRSGAR